MEPLRFLIFVCFWIFSLRFVFVFLFYTPDWIKPIGYIALLAGCMITWINPLLTLYTFIALVPFVSGVKHILAGFEQFSFIKNAPILSLVFSIIYISWLGRRVFFEKKILRPKNSTGNLVDILSAIAILSMIACSLRYPLTVVWDNFTSLQFSGQDDPFWFFQAGTIFLQGLFLYRLLSTELPKNENEINFMRVYFIHAIGIVFFSVLQLSYKIPSNNFQALNSPFDDIHSYGSYTLVCFFIFFYTYLSDKRNIAGLIFSFFLFIFIFLSSSFTTVIVLLAISTILLSFRYRWFRYCGVLIVLWPIILYFNTTLPVDSKSWHPILRRYAERANVETALSRLQGRMQSADQALGMIKNNPITGRGIGTFYRLSKYYHISDQPHLKRIENAHNYYLQLTAELGIIALAVFLFIVILTFKKGFAASLADKPKNNLKIGLMLGISAYLITMLTGHPLLLSNQQFLFWFALLALASLCPEAEENSRLDWIKTRSRSWIGGLLAILLLASHAYNITAREFDEPGFEYGLYKTENINGKQLRWTKKIACRRIQAESDIIGFVLSAAPFNLTSNPLSVQVLLNDKLVEKVHFFSEGVTPLYYYISSLSGNQIELKTTASNTFNPYALGVNKDLKHNWEHGIAVSEINFLKIMPRAGIGFYEWETEDITKENENIGPEKIMFRYTRMRASIPASYFRNIEGEDSMSKTYTVFLLRCSHPDIFDDPVNVEIIDDNRTLYQKNFSNHQWNKVIVRQDRISQDGILTFSVNRSWNPKLAGISEDGRDLGVAVAVIPR